MYTVNIELSKCIILSTFKQIQDELNLSTEELLIRIKWAKVRGTY